MAMTTYQLSAIAKVALVRNGLWDSVPANVQAQWSQRFYNNKAAVRAAAGKDEDAMAYVRRLVEQTAAGKGIGSGSRREGAESPAEFLDRMS